MEDNLAPVATNIKDDRLTQAIDWLKNAWDAPLENISLLQGDASFRRYFRAVFNNQHAILMDAPPAKESCASFVAIAHCLRDCGINAPIIYVADIKQGFLLLSDFGDELLLNHLNNETMQHHYTLAMNDLLVMQRCKGVRNWQLPYFNWPGYIDRMHDFEHWYCDQHLGLTLTASEQLMLNDTYALLLADAIKQPRVFVHRDYHSRNLMICSDTQLGNLDFQDAEWGPITYDLISLLKDCYIDWPIEQVHAMALQYQQQLIKTGLLDMDDPKQFIQWLDWVGLMRHIRCTGLFARLKYRDNKPNYLQYHPRLLNYMTTVCDQYPALAPFSRFLKERIPTP